MIAARRDGDDEAAERVRRPILPVGSPGVIFRRLDDLEVYGIADVGPDQEPAVPVFKGVLHARFAGCDEAWRRRWVLGRYQPGLAGFVVAGGDDHIGARLGRVDREKERFVGL